MSNPFTDDTTASRHAFEWGLASLICGVGLLAMTPVMLIFDAYMWTSVYDATPDRDDRWGMRVGAFVGLFGLPIVCGVDFLFGMIGLSSAIRNRQPAGIPLAGVLLAALNFCLWIALFVLLLFILQTFR